MKQQPSRIKDVVGAVIAKMSGEKKDKIDQIQEAWRAVVDKRTNAHARPASFRTKKLIVSVDSSAWMYELNMRKDQIKAGINSRLEGSKEAVKEIILRIGEAG